MDLIEQLIRDYHLLMCTVGPIQRTPSDRQMVTYILLGKIRSQRKVISIQILSLNNSKRSIHLSTAANQNCVKWKSP